MKNFFKTIWKRGFAYSELWILCLFAAVLAGVFGSYPQDLNMLEIIAVTIFLSLILLALASPALWLIKSEFKK